MEEKKEIIEKLFEKYKTSVDTISALFHYPDNIKHLLTIITTAFVLKYGYQKEEMILRCLEETPILIQDEKNKRIQASYVRIPTKENDSFRINKGIVLSNYEGIDLMQLLENLIHELNHAVNSFKKEFIVRDSLLFLRTGLTSIVYDTFTLTVQKKEDSYILEEIINTKQTESILNIIYSFSQNEYADTEINHTLYAIKHAMSDYKSTAYAWETYACKSLLENKTFTSTLENLRLTGDIEDIPTWFDSIYGEEGTYQKLIELLLHLVKLEKQESKKEGFRFLRKKRQQETLQSLQKIGERFSHNCNFT